MDGHILSKPILTLNGRLLGLVNMFILEDSRHGKFQWQRNECYYYLVTSCWHYRVFKKVALNRDIDNCMTFALSLINKIGKMLGFYRCVLCNSAYPFILDAHLLRLQTFCKKYKFIVSRLITLQIVTKDFHCALSNIRNTGKCFKYSLWIIVRCTRRPVFYDT
jgi:hypothetical protein